MISHEIASGLEIDLHGKTWHEALPEFIAFYNEALHHAGGGPAARLNVIHGYGSTGAGGVLRKRLHNYLAEQARLGRLEFTPGRARRRQSRPHPRAAHRAPARHA